ncbi:cupin-like domain-containing protein [Silvibacterium acidisoli]|uniref:cupin-like domain-containing protein n=1 Tax=Acidobacteriaceae bacterium ZG23-2 TaxID=2883246 RepID=UPI00406BE29E
MQTEKATDRTIKVVPIERRNAADLPYEKFLREYVIPNRPVIIKDAMPQWNALHRWTPEFFKSRFGAEEVDVTYGGVKMSMAALIDAVLASTAEKPGPYLHKVIIHQHMPQLLPDLSPENAYGFPRRYCSPLMPKRFRRPDGYLKLLIGGVGGKFPLMHFDGDNANAMISEIYGDKEFVLFSPEDTPNIYAHPETLTTSQIDDLVNPDLEKFPLLARAVQYRGIIQPGETIFVPSKWWHSARVVSTSISVCTNMLDRVNWNGFVAESCNPRIVKSAPTRVVKAAYLHAIGAVMSAVETWQKWFPHGALSRKLSYVSPISSLADSRRKMLLESSRS